MSTNPLLAKARKALEAGDYDGAVAFAEEAMAKAPRSVEARILLAEVALDEADFERAWAIAEDTLAIEEGNPIVQLLAAEAALMLEDLDAVLQLTEPILVRDPGNFRARHIMAEALLDLGLPKDAQRLFETLVEEAEEFPDGWLGLAVSHFELAEWNQSMAALKELGRLAPELADVHHYQALNLERLGDARGARRAFKKARELDPERFPEPLEVSIDAFEAIVEEVITSLPPRLKALMANVPISVEPYPSEAEMKAADPPLSPRIWGLFRGHSILDAHPDSPFTGEGQPAAMPAEIVLYRENLQRGVRDEEELLDEIRITLLHEIGHYLGWDEDEVAAHGLE